jgi:hypothetical protein
MHLMILGTLMLPGVAGILGGRLLRAWWILGVNILEVYRLIRTL